MSKNDKPFRFFQDEPSRFTQDAPIFIDKKILELPEVDHLD